MIHKQYCKTLEHVCRRIILSFLFLFCFSELSFFWRNSSTFQFIFSHALTSSLLTCVFRVICMCDACGGKEKPMRPSEWERHTGCRKKKWKESIRVKNPDQPLVSWLQQMLGAGAIGLAYELPDIIVPAKQREQALLSALDAPYKPVESTWTSERCAVCRWVVDYDYNKMIICNRCQVAVHEECYGVKASESMGSWVCRACETPDHEQECCLCPVKGGALKPSTLKGLWVHITCGWFVPEVRFKDAAKMEPADGLIDINLSTFHQVCQIPILSRIFLYYVLVLLYCSCGS
jgi:hypothetical protein